MNPTQLLATAALATLTAVSCAKGNTVFGEGAGGSGGDGETYGSGGSGGHAATTGSGGSGGSMTTGTSEDGGAPDSGGVDAGGPCATAVDCVSLSDQCNQGACINAVCIRAPANEFGACDDGQFCTDNEACTNGVCGGGTPKFCSPGNDGCHLGVCDEASKSCKVTPGNDGNPCSDSDPCTATAACQGGACAAQTQKDCSFLNSTCATGTCDSKLGCVSKPNADGTACDDGIYCTVGDVCKAGACGGKPNTCAPPGADICMIGQCDEGSKSCIAVPGNDGKACNDGNLCTAGETCSAGKCLGGKPANNGVACDDADACTDGTTCVNGACGNPKSQIAQCIDGDKCCPPGCLNDKDCLWWTGGVQQNVAPSQLTGWTECYADTYDVPLETKVQGIVQQQCLKGKLMLACRQKGQPNWQLAAMGLRADVLFDCGSETKCTHVANGVGWYYSPSYSWGFVSGSDPVSRNSCDTEPGPLRLCWHTVSNAGGYRCGDTLGLNSDAGWERAVFQAD